MNRALLLILLLALTGCAPDRSVGGGAHDDDDASADDDDAADDDDVADDDDSVVDPSDDDDVVVEDSEHTEAEDFANDSPFTGEVVEAPWGRQSPQLVIHGSLRDCGYEQAEDWPWLGDNDFYLVEVVDAGRARVELAWNGGSGDLDFVAFINLGDSGGVPVVQETGTGDPSPVVLGEDLLEPGDVLSLGALCASSSGGGDYIMSVSWSEG